MYCTCPVFVQNEYNYSKYVTVQGLAGLKKTDGVNW